MQIFDIQTDSSNKELTTHGFEDFPCSFYDETFSKFINGYVPWHWHDEVEMVYVVEGRTKVESFNQSVVIEKGEAVFINSGCLHQLTDVGSSDCHILNFVYAPFFVGGTRYSRIFRNFVSPVITNTNLDLYKFTPDVGWQRDIIQELNQGFAACRTADDGFEMLTQAHITKTWQIFYKNEPSIRQNNTTSESKETRLHDALTYIHSHYAEAISVADISRASNISESECYRVFRNKLKCTPNNYLLDYRLQCAATYLLETDKPITDIALQVGFNQASYFTKRFTQAYGKTPKTFRQQDNKG